MRDLTSFERAGTLVSVLAYIEELKKESDSRRMTMEHQADMLNEYVQKLAAREQERAMWKSKYEETVEWQMKHYKPGNQKNAPPETS